MFILDEVSVAGQSRLSKKRRTCNICGDVVGEKKSNVTHWQSICPGILIQYKLVGSVKDMSETWKNTNRLAVHNSMKDHILMTVIFLTGASFCMAF